MIDQMVVKTTKGREFHPLSDGARDERRRDDGEHHLKIAKPSVLGYGSVTSLSVSKPGRTS
jgi:hypothetical protein